MIRSAPAIPPVDPEEERKWREYLENPDSFIRVGRRVFSRIPTGPRCQMCASPFHGPGRPVMRLIGKKQSRINPNLCNSCENYMLKPANAKQLVAYGESRANPALHPVDLAAWSMLANQLMNLDEVLNK